MYYLVYINCPIFTGSKKDCVARKDEHIRKGLRHDFLIVVSVAEWNRIMSEEEAV